MAVQDVLPFVQVVHLTNDEYVALLGRVAQLGITGGAIYDAILAL